MFRVKSHFMFSLFLFSKITVYLFAFAVRFIEVKKSSRTTILILQRNMNNRFVKDQEVMWPSQLQVYSFVKVVVFQKNLSVL